MNDKTIGSNAQRQDGADKVRGKPIYAADDARAHMAYALPLLATVGKGRITRIDTSKAEAIPGVILVLTYKNMEKLKPMRFLFAGGQGAQSLQPLQSDAVAYRGQVVALLVANTVEAAHEAIGLIDVEYAAVPFSVELDSAGGESVVQAVAAPYFKDMVAGDAAQALASAGVVVDQTYSTPTQHHNAMELLSTVAEWQGNRLLVHEGTQNAQAMAVGLALQLGMDPQNVRVTAPYVGGGFGGRNSLAPHTVLAAVAARRTRRPVKLVLPRDQGFYDIPFRPAARHRIRLGADQNGKFVAAIHDVHAQTSRFDLFPFTGAETSARLYGFPSFGSTTTLVKLDTQTPGFMRAPFEMSSAVAMEGAVDTLAYQLKRDPVQLRLANDTQVDSISGKPLSSRHLNECLERGAKRFGWERRNAQPGSMRDADGTLLGWGVACGAYPGYIAPTRATVQLKADGSAVVWVGGHEMGQGIRTSIALVAAERLGIDPRKITVIIGDTIAPPQHLTAGSWGTATATPAVLKACDAALARRKSSGKQEAVGKTDSLAPGQTPDAMAHALQGVVAAGGPEFPDFVTFSYIAHFVEVRINPRLPRARVSRVVSVVDCGRVVSRRTASSQIYGGIVWGIGAALTEQSEIDPRFGGFLNTNIAEYAIPVNADMGTFDVDFIDAPDLKFNPIGAKGLGEVASVGVAAAIVNAIYHATGKRVYDLPITIEKLM